MGAEDHRVVVRHFVQFLDEDRAALLQVVDHEAVVHHFMADVDGRAQRFDRALDDLDRTIDTGTETTRVGEQHIHQFNLPAAAGLRFRIGIIRLFGGLAVEQAKQGDADGPHHDGRIGDVERGPGVAAHVPLDEIDHVAVHLAVDHVADGTADDQRIRHRGLPVAAGGAAQPPGHQSADGDRQRGEEVLLPATGVAQETERRAGVVGAIPVPEAIDDHHRLELRQARQHPGLGPLVQADDGRRQQQPDQGVGLRARSAHQNQLRSSPVPVMLLTQRPHSSGWSALLPTSARWCQQRTHLALVVGWALTNTSSVVAGRTCTSPLMNRKRSSSASGCHFAACSSLAAMVISASSAAPIAPLARIGSSTLATCSRTASSWSKSAALSWASAGSGARPSYQVVNSTCPARSPGR
ncbi:hypothetical protein G6F57_015295 [Rhizopus arrhizus]|nr:hypothetical protein G6F57_015295 [Rhizopus arrhizus]